MRSIKFSRLIFFVLLFVFAVFGLPALAQEVPALAEVETDGKLMAIFMLAIPFLASLISASFPSDGVVMRIIDVFAVNLGYAKNTGELNPNTVADRA